MPVYTWHNQQEGKEEYAKFSKEFGIRLKQLRYVLDPATVARRLGPPPVLDPPANARLRKEWREDKIRYEGRQNKIDSDFSEALSALELSFKDLTPPRHIIDKTIDDRPANITEDDWNFERKFRACWEALRAEYQPSTAVDLSQLRDQIFALNDQIPGGFDAFRSEFHRLHAEIVATRVPDGIREAELNGIVRDGLKNRMVWALIGFNIYNNNPNAPWARTFEAVSSMLTSFRLKGIDPYDDASSGPLVGHTPVSANMASNTAAATTTTPNDKRADHAKRQLSTPREPGGRFHKSQKTSSTSPATTEKWSSHQTTTSRADPRPERKCTRCWAVTAHDYRNCKETKCICGKPLENGQLVCFNYDNHQPGAQFPADKIPPSVAAVLDAYKRGRAATTSGGQPPHKEGHGGKQAKGKNRRGTKAFAASVAEELIRRGAGGRNLDSMA